MTTVICDICKETIPTDKDSIASLPSIKFGTHDKYQFCTAPLKATCQFNTTNFAICEKCLIKAFKEAVEKL